MTRPSMPTTWKHHAAVVGLVVGVLALFLNKAFTIDDPLFLALARHLLHDPFDFYRFDVNWYGEPSPMFEVTKNPPLAGYFTALGARLVGWSEPALHAVFLIPAGLAASGTFALARRLCARPVEATVLGLMTPVFLVSGTTVMSDVLLLAIWCWAVWFWIRGLDDERWSFLLISAALVGAAGLTKYFGVALVPLLLVYGLIRKRSLGAWAFALCVPILVFGGYQWLTSVLYGRGLLLDAAEFATEQRSGHPGGFIGQSITGLVFAGGCLIPALFCAPLIWSRRALWVGAALAAGGFVWILAGDVIGGLSVGPIPLPLASSMQALALAVGGISFLALALVVLRSDGSAENWLLFLWIAGTFVFATYLNWVNNGRSNLPMAPALGLLLVRRMDRLRNPLFTGPSSLWPVAGIVVALCVAYGDYQWANAAREAARHVAASGAGHQGKTYYRGGWGFQYYMETDAAATNLKPDVHVPESGDRLVTPSYNLDVFHPGELAMTLVDEIRPRGRGWVHTVSLGAGANFYSSGLGPLPFVFGPTRPDVYRIWAAARNRPVPDGSTSGDETVE